MSDNKDFNLDFLDEKPKSIFCSNCGEKIKEGSSFCSSCGEKLLKDEKKIENKIETEQKEIKKEELKENKEKESYASFKIRLGAYIIDLLGLIIIAVIIGLVIALYW